MCIRDRHGDRSERSELRGERVDVIKRVGKTELSRANDPAAVFGICAGLQLIGIAFGAPLVYPGEGYEEFGFLPQTVLAQHPLTAGLGGTLHCFEHHRGQLSTVPEGFRLLASRGNCRVQMLAHESRPIFGTQFHPELQNAAHRDGQRILENFFAYYVK